MPKTRRGVTVNIDKDRSRTFIWDLEARSNFEDEVGDWMKVPRSQMIQTLFILETSLSKAKVLHLAVFWALHHDDPDLTRDQASQLIEDYVQKHGSLDDIEEKLKESYLQAWDPNGLASWKRRYAKLKKLQSLQLKAQEKDQMAKEAKADESIADLEKKIAAGSLGLSDSEPSS